MLVHHNSVISSLKKCDWFYTPPPDSRVQFVHIFNLNWECWQSLTYIYIYIYVYIYMYIYVCVCVYVCVCLYIYIITKNRGITYLLYKKNYISNIIDGYNSPILCNHLIHKTKNLFIYTYIYIRGLWFLQAHLVSLWKTKCCNIIK